MEKAKLTKPFEKLYKRPLTEREDFEIRDNLKQFFEVLIEIDKEQNNDQSKRDSNNNNQAK